MASTSSSAARAEHYREKAKEARQAAQAARADETSIQLHRIANGWEGLAAIIEAPRASRPEAEDDAQSESWEQRPKLDDVLQEPGS